VVGLAQLAEDDEILVVTTQGKIIRLPSFDIRLQGRNTYGVRIINLESGDRVGSLARVAAERS
jgi:DNA gyrase subunit A